MAKEKYGFVPDGNEDGFVADDDFQPEDPKPTKKTNEFEVARILQQEAAAQEARKAAAAKFQEEAAKRDPRNWTLKQTQDHFKNNPPRTPQEEVQAKILIDAKKDALKRAAGAEFRAAPPPSLKDSIMEVLSKPFVQTPEEKQAKAQNVMAIAHVYGISPAEVERNYDAMARRFIQRDPTGMEIIKTLAIAPIVAGLVSNPVATGIGLASFAGLSEIENGAVSMIKKEPYQFARGRTAKDLLPAEANALTHELIDLAEFVGLGFAAHGVSKNTAPVVERFMKDFVTSHKLPKEVYYPLASGEDAKIPTEKLPVLAQKDGWKDLKEEISAAPTPPDVAKARKEALEASILERETGFTPDASKMQEKAISAQIKATQDAGPIGFQTAEDYLASKGSPLYHANDQGIVGFSGEGQPKIYMSSDKAALSNYGDVVTTIYPKEGKTVDFGNKFVDQILDGKNPDDLLKKFRPEIGDARYVKFEHPDGMGGTYSTTVSLYPKEDLKTAGQLIAEWETARAGKNPVAAGDLATVNGRSVSVQRIEGDQAHIITNGKTEVIPAKDLVRVNTPEEVINLPEVVAARKEAAGLPETIKINTPERDRMRHQIAGKAYGSGNYAKEGIVDIVIGGPSTGKSQVVDPLLQVRKALKIDNDDLKVLIGPEYKNGIGAAAVHKESALIEAKLRALSQWEKDNVVIARLGKNPEAIREVYKEYYNAGYRRFNLHLVELPVEKAMFRTVNRFLERGRFVDPLYVQEVSLTPRQTYDMFLKEGNFNEYTRYSTDVPKGTSPIVTQDTPRAVAGERGVHGTNGPNAFGNPAGEAGGVNEGAVQGAAGIPPGRLPTPKLTIAEATARAVQAAEETQKARLVLEMDQHYKTPQGNLFVAIRRLGGIKPEEALAGEQADIPFFLKNKNSQSTLDDLATQLDTYGWKFEDGNALKNAIIHQARNPLPKIDRANYKEFLKQAEKNQALMEDIAGKAGKRRKFITTVKEAEKTAPEVAQNIESRYDPISNEQTLAEARDMIARDPEGALATVEGPERPNRVTNAIAQLLIDKAQNEGRFQDAIRLVERTAEKNTELGQTIQALAMYSRLTPEGVLRFASKQLAKVDVKVDAELAQNLHERAQKIQDIGEWLKNPDWESPLYKATRRATTPYFEFGPKGVAGENTPTGKGKQLDMEIGYSQMSRAQQIETALMLKEIAKKVPPNALQKVAMVQTMAQLLNPKTFVRNLLGNIGFSITDNMAQMVGTALDVAVSLRTGKRTQYLPDLGVQAKGMAKGIVEGTQEALLGIDLKNPGNSKFDLPRNSVFNEGVMGALEKALSVSLGATDRAFYQAAFNDSMRMQLRAAKATEPTGEMVERAHYAGLYRTFQDENAVTRLFVGLKKALNVGKDFGLGDIVIKYPKTPANLLARGIEYSPFGFIQTAFKLADPLFGKSFDQQAVVQSAARALTGSSLLVGSGAILAQLGIISGKREKDRDVAATLQSVGIREYQLNTDALKRFVASGFDPEQAKLQEGDHLTTYDWMQPASIGLALGANMIIAKDNSVTDKVINMADRVFEASETLASQPLVQGLKAITGRQSISEGVAEALKGIPASFVPTLLNQVRQLVDNTARNTKDPNYYREMTKKVMGKVPGLSDKLPPRITPFGEEQEVYQNDTNGIFNVFFNPTFASQYEPDRVSRMVLDIWERSGQTVQFPRVVSAKIKVGPESIEMTPDQYREFQAYVGTKTDTLFGILADNEKFMALPDDVKAKKLQGMLTDINTAAKIEVLGYQPKRTTQGVEAVIQGIGRKSKEIRQIPLDEEDEFQGDE